MIEMPFSPTVAEHMALAMADLAEAADVLEGFSLIGSTLEIHDHAHENVPTIFVKSESGEVIRFDRDAEWERLMECIDCSHNEWTDTPSEWFCRVCGSDQHEESMQSQHAPRVL